MEDALHSLMSKYGITDAMVEESQASLPKRLKERFKRALSNQSNFDFISYLDEYLDELPYCLVQAHTFDTINLSHQKVTILPAWLNALSSVNRIDISHNPLEIIDSSLSLNLVIDSSQWLAHKNNLVNCTIIGFVMRPEDINQFSDLSALPFFTSLTSLAMSNCRLTHWPDDLPKQLETLVLNDNQLFDWPSIWPDKLQRINLDNNQLPDWPSVWPDLLQRIHLDSNQLSDWPSVWPDQLQHIDLDNNKISVWPNTWPQHIKNILISHNQLSEWPHHWPTQIEVFSLSYNQLSNWPSAWPDLPSLRLFSLGGNGLGEDVDALEISDIEALKKLFERSAERVFINEAKLLIVGEPASGKTSLMKKLKDPTHIPKPNSESTTEGINIAQWPLVNRNFTANVWDFGGQEIQYATHKFFLTERAVYVVVADNRAQKTNFDYWLRIINLLGKKDSKVIVFLHDKENTTVTNFSENEYHTKFPDFGMESFHANLADENIQKFDVLQNAIEEALTSLPFLKEKVDKKWLEVKHHIASLKESGQHDISYRELENICVAQGLDRVEVEPLAKYLNWMGVIIYFENDHSSLRDFIIIDPEWAVNPLYQIMKHDVDQKNGVFEETFFFQLLDDNLYNPVQKSHLLTLLTKDHFEICYPITGKKGHYVVPQLLPETSNHLDIENHPQTQGQPLVYEFEYRFLPKGLFSRLIVRHFTSIAKDNAGHDYVWRSGVVFNEGNCAVEILMKNEIDKVYGTLTLKVYGEENLRRNALLKYRGEIQKLNRELSQSLEGEVDEKVPCRCTSCNNSNAPEYFPLHRLETNSTSGKSTVECGKSGIDVPISALIEDIIPMLHMPDIWELKMHEIEMESEMEPELFPFHQSGKLMEKVDKMEDQLQRIMIEIAKSQQSITINNNVQATNTNNITIDIEQKNQHCFNINGFLDEMKDHLNTHPKATAEVEQAEKLVDQINDSDKVEKAKLSRLKGMIDNIRNGTSEVGKVMDSVQGLKEPASKLIDGYNAIAGLFSLPVIDNFLK